MLKYRFSPSYAIPAHLLADQRFAEALNRRIAQLFQKPVQLLSLIVRQAEVIPVRLLPAINPVLRRVQRLDRRSCLRNKLHAVFLRRFALRKQAFVELRVVSPYRVDAGFRTVGIYDAPIDECWPRVQAAADLACKTWQDWLSQL